jgi:hypothetical protein
VRSFLSIYYQTLSYLSANKRLVYEEVKKAVERDRSMVKVSELSRHGLMEITRKRVRSLILKAIFSYLQISRNLKNQHENGWAKMYNDCCECESHCALAHLFSCCICFLSIVPTIWDWLKCNMKGQTYYHLYLIYRQDIHLRSLTQY